MKSLENFYQDKITNLELEIKTQKTSINFSSTTRLICFGLIVFGLYFFFGNARLMVLTAVVGFGVFFYLVLRHERLKAHMNYLKALHKINATELSVLDGDFHSQAEGTDFIDATHDFSFDIDLFGRGSFFQYFNRTSTNAGTQSLVATLTGNTIEAIPRKQAVIQELAKKVDWRQSFSATASLVEVGQDSEGILKWIQNYKSNFSTKLKVVVPIFSVMSLVIITTFIIGFIPEVIVLLWFVM